MGLQKNFIYSSILTTSTYVVSLVTYPYLSRTLGVSNIGIVNFIDNLVNYFIFFSMMGIMTVGVREIAAIRNNPTELSKTFSSLFSLTAGSTLLAVTILWVAMYTVATLEPYQDLLYFGLVKLVFNLFLMEWFFIGMEEFQYITRRSLFIRTLFVISVFIFIKDASDYKILFLLMVSMVVANALVNLIYSKKFVKFSFQSKDLRLYYKPFIIMGIYVLFTNIYTTLNTVWLGFVTDTVQVGYFTTATKLHTLSIAFLTSFSNILFPRVSNLLAEGKEHEFWSKINTSFDALFLFAFPVICFLLSAGPDLLHLFVGDGYEGSYLPLRIIAPLILIIGIEQILVIQILMAMHRDNIVLRNSFIGAIAAMTLNILLTTHFGAIGSAVVWICVECIIMIASMAVIYKSYHYLFPYKRLAAYIIVYTPLLISSLVLYSQLENGYMAMFVIALLTVVYMLITELFVLKNTIARQLLRITKA